MGTAKPESHPQRTHTSPISITEPQQRLKVSASLSRPGGEVLLSLI